MWRRGSETVDHAVPEGKADPRTERLILSPNQRSSRVAGFGEMERGAAAPFPMAYARLSNGSRMNNPVTESGCTSENASQRSLSFLVRSSLRLFRPNLIYP